MIIDSVLTMLYNGNVHRNWPRYAKALDLHLQGKILDDIGRELGVTRARAQQMVFVAKHQLAFRVFKLPRPFFHKF
jgi:hypothetical protein